MARSKRAEKLLRFEPEVRRAVLRKMSPRQRGSLKRHWRLWAHEGQVPPAGGWHTWLIMAGRGYGKTRAGAEWVREIAEADPTTRIALVGGSLGEARRVMVEGESGLLAIAPPRQRPHFEPSKRQLTWPGGAIATLYSAAEPESLRGPQHSPLSGQAQKEFFVNEAHALTDLLLHPAIEGVADAPPANPADGESWLIGDTPSGAWSGHAGELTSCQAGTWVFAAPRDGLQVLDRSNGQNIRFCGSWQRPTSPATPSGGTTIDTEARTAITELVAALIAGGLFAQP